MRVAVDVVPIRPGGQTGGAQHVLCELIKGLGQMFRDDEFILLTAAWNHDFFSEYERIGISRLCVESESSDPEQKNKSILRKIIRKTLPFMSNKLKFTSLRENNVDVLFCPMSAVTYAEPGVPTVSLIHDIQHEYYPQFFSTTELQHRKKFYQQICEIADAVICVSEFTRQTFLEKYNFYEEKTFVVYNSIQDRIKKYNAEEIIDILGKYGLEVNQYAFYPANFWPHKNHLMLLTAFSMFVHRNRESNLNLVFSGALSEQHKIIRDAIKQMGLEQRVFLLGYLNDDELSAVFEGCNFVIFPSLFEGFGIPIIEAMSLGKPVLCSSVTSLPEVGGDAALYFDPRQPKEIVNALEQVLKNSVRNEIITKGFKQVKKFDFNEMILAYRRILHEVSIKGGGNGYKMHGVFEDGWTGSNFKVMIGKSSYKRLLKLELLCSGPKTNVKVLIRVNNTKVAQHKFNSGQSESISLPISQEPAIIDVSVDPTFNPSDYGSKDIRDLGLIVKTAEIRNAASGTLLKKLC